MKVAIISCVSKKRKGEHKARNLYNSDLFKKSLLYTERNFDKVLILSAKYGCITPDRVIGNYELTLKRFNRGQKQSWALFVAKQLKKHIKPDDHIYWFAGNDYRVYLKKMLPNKQYEPLKGLGIGKQLQFYKNNLICT